MKECILVAAVFLFLAAGFCFLLEKKEKKNKKLNSLLMETQEKNQKMASYMDKVISGTLNSVIGNNKENEMLDVEPQLMQTVIMNVNGADFASIVFSKQFKELFHVINHLFEHIIPEVYGHNGTVEKFEGAGFLSFFEENYKDALESAIAISCEIQKQAAQNSLYHKFSIGICYGEVYAGMVGNENRISLLTISEFTGFAAFLQSIAGKYYAKILATQSFLERIEDYDKKYNVRVLGYVKMREIERVEKIYDVFDGDAIAVRNAKRKTKIAFEKGVAFFEKEQYMLARQYFIEVIKTDGLDKAAKEYLYLCEKYKNGEASGTERVCFETYE